MLINLPFTSSIKVKLDILLNQNKISINKITEVNGRIKGVTFKSESGETFSCEVKPSQGRVHCTCPGSYVNYLAKDGEEATKFISCEHLKIFNFMLNNQNNKG
jgi:hypothetical protein